jgi:hypothetical protein
MILKNIFGHSSSGTPANPMAFPFLRTSVAGVVAEKYSFLGLIFIISR